MTLERQIYRCSVCGNIVEVINAGGGTLVCCGKEMELLNEKTSDTGMEKHVPVIENTEDGVLVKVGSVEHPMEEKHHIAWIELHTPLHVYRKYLKAGDKPHALFKPAEDVSYAREYCTLHGLWKSK